MEKLEQRVSELAMEHALLCERVQTLEKAFDELARIVQSDVSALRDRFVDAIACVKDAHVKLGKLTKRVDRVNERVTDLVGG